MHRGVNHSKNGFERLKDFSQIYGDLMVDLGFKDLLKIYGILFEIYEFFLGLMNFFWDLGMFLGFFEIYWTSVIFSSASMCIIFFNSIDIIKCDHLYLCR